MQMTPETDVILIGFHLPGGMEITFPIRKDRSGTSPLFYLLAGVIL